MYLIIITLTGAGLLLVFSYCFARIAAPGNIRKLETQIAETTAQRQSLGAEANLPAVFDKRLKYACQRLAAAQFELTEKAYFAAECSAAAGLARLKRARKLLFNARREAHIKNTMQQ